MSGRAIAIAMKLARHKRKAMLHRIGNVLPADRDGLLRELNRLDIQKGKKPESSLIAEKWRSFEERLVRAEKKKGLRLKQRPAVIYPEGLPILEKRAEIIEALHRHQVLVITGETGSGKTTQLPKMCLEAGLGIDGIIGCTQPRRIAAVSIARRIAEELGVEPGQSVGHKIRFEDRTNRHGYIKIMTDGILIMEAQSDPLLRRYDTLIIDEAHERSVNIDFILGILKNLIKDRMDLRIIITSATIEPGTFSRAFDNAPIIEVSGRSWPVEVRYRPASPACDEEGPEGYVEAALAAVEELKKERRRGHILIFMPTEQDIRDTCKVLSGRNYRDSLVMPLYGRLPSGYQQRVFKSTREDKIIVSTNVAETSLTVPGIRYVIDTGLARISEYRPHTRTMGLPVKAVSRSSAIQRAGRCGRVESGVCIRLYSEEEYESRPLHTPPEILRTNLAEVIIRMMHRKLGHI
ncbi:MAG: helicase-related protein, partial [Syntrophales bacterium]|nr:helicase-related protein [Syntrophales bacterium]